MNMLCSRVTLARGPVQLCPMPACTLVPEDTHLRHRGCPRFKGGDTEALRAKCWSRPGEPISVWSLS